MRSGLTMLLAFAALALDAPAADWVRAGATTNRPVWGLRQGLLWGIHPGRVRDGAPRGLIRLGYPVLPGGQYDLINFIAIEPVIKARRGLSELEASQLDNVPGKRIWADAGDAPNPLGTNLVPGHITSLPKGVEQLELTLRVEEFLNGAHVWLAARQRSDRPDELELRVHTVTNSVALDYCILTATMGNKARTRQLWLRDEIFSSLKLHPNHRSTEFAPHTVFPVARLQRTADGDVLVAVTTDEEHPEEVHPFPGRPHWYYGGGKVTQYWRKPAGSFRDDLQVAVNARYTYWNSRQPIPGGIAFENFELRERFREGQRVIFSITRKTPEELGFTSRP